MKKLIILSAIIAIIFGACSAKEINEGVDSITSDVTNAINKEDDK